MEPVDTTTETKKAEASVVPDRPQREQRGKDKTSRIPIKVEPMKGPHAEKARLDTRARAGSALKYQG